MPKAMNSEQAVVITPIDELQRAQVVRATQRWVERAADLLAHPMAVPPVLFDLSGSTAGMFRAQEQLVVSAITHGYSPGISMRTCSTRYRMRWHIMRCTSVISIAA